MPRLPWKRCPVLLLSLLLAWPQGLAAPGPAGESAPGDRRALPARSPEEKPLPPDAGPGRRARELAILGALPGGSVRGALMSSGGEGDGATVPPEPPREAAGRSKPPWYRSRTAVILMVVAGAALAGRAALSSFREDS